MAYINFLDNYGIVANKSKVIKELQMRCKSLKNMNERRVAMTVNASSFPEFWYNADLERVSESLEPIHLKLINLGVDSKDCEPVYAEFVKGSLGFNFTRLGSLHELDKNVMKEEIEKGKTEIKEEKEKLKKEQIEQEKSQNLDAEQAFDIAIHTVRSVERNSFYETLYERLMIPKSFPTEEDLKRYIMSIITRINYLLEDDVSDISDFVVYNSNKTSALINSALIDKFGKVIYLIVKMHSSNSLSFTNMQICSGRTMLVSFGFGRVNLDKIKRVRFYDKDLSELIFNADIEDFDLDNWSRLEHCIERQQERLTGRLHDASPEMIYSDMVNAINIGVSISRFDSSYIKPFYSRKHNTISFIIPYHIGNNFQEKPELGIIVSKFDTGDYWQAMTIIDYDMALADTKLLSLYSEVSF